MTISLQEFHLKKDNIMGKIKVINGLIFNDILILTRYLCFYSWETLGGRGICQEVLCDGKVRCGDTGLIGEQIDGGIFNSTTRNHCSF